MRSGFLLKRDIIHRHHTHIVCQFTINYKIHNIPNTPYNNTTKALYISNGNLQKQTSPT
ncbi:hypothetical protein [Rubritalea tangerina]|uniref:hypothetical protein n=1 Tax=Rubritalea tangerina TaxID=430798 RepID=UPI00361BC890